jgi:CHAT domain-containing protein/tetratricopeptide (TPR) repeat protein
MAQNPFSLDDDDFYHLVAAWLTTGQSRNETRRFLETHPALLQPHTLIILESLIPQLSEHPDEQAAIRNYQRVVQDAITRHHTAPLVNAVRMAYVNAFGGFVLDLPPWLPDIAMLAARQAEATAHHSEAQFAAYLTALRQRAIHEGLPAEVSAELAALIGYTLGDIHDDTREQAQEDALGWYNQALEIYTEERLPQRWQMIQVNIGNLYADRMSGEKADNQEHAIAHYIAALRVDVPPLRVAGAQNFLGNVYASRIRGDPSENQEQAISCYTAALQHLQQEQSPIDWAMIHQNLGTIYAKRIQGEKASNQERAISCFIVALQVLTKEQYPTNWIALQNMLGNVYGERITGDPVENQERAISSYSAALQSLIAAGAPMDWVETQHALGILYKNRFQGDPAENEELAISCLTTVAQIYLENGSPLDWARAQSDLGNAYVERIQGDKADNQERAISCFLAAADVLAKFPSLRDRAMVENNLGNVYRERVQGDKSDNQERALSYFTSALSAWPEEHPPLDWALTHHNLGIVYAERIVGDKADNQERAIVHFTTALSVYIEAQVVADQASVQNSLGNIYQERVRGHLAENQEQSIAYYTASLQVWTEERTPRDWAIVHRNLGNVCAARLQGDTAENQEYAIACYMAALRVYTEERLPLEWAGVQSSLGNLYQHRLRGDPAENQESAIACYTAALRVYTEDQLPFEWAKTQHNLGNAYAERMRGNIVQNQEHAIACYVASLQVFGADRLPAFHRTTATHLAELYSDLGRWDEAQATYASARRAETLLIATTPGVEELDRILRDGRDLALREAYALVQLGRVSEATLVIEQGRGRTLAAARAQLAANPDRIGDPQRKARYLAARRQMQTAQVVFYDPLQQENVAERRAIWLERSTAISTARQQLDAILQEIADAGDPADFIPGNASLSLFDDALMHCPPNHALVYLLATPWGGLALVIQTDTHKQEMTSHLFPNLTIRNVTALIDNRLADPVSRVIGGIAGGQISNAFTWFVTQDWSGETFKQRASHLRTTCQNLHVTQSGFLTAADEILGMPEFAAASTMPLHELEQQDAAMFASLAGTFNKLVLCYEIRRSLMRLAEMALRPLVASLQAQHITNMTLIPCGELATFPLLAVPVGPMGDEHDPSSWHTLADAFPHGASVAPSARALIQTAQSLQTRSGLKGVGNPLQAGKPLRWGQAEALTLGELAGTPDAIHILNGATKAYATEALRTAYIFEASCHGKGGRGDFLDYGIFLARHETLTLRDIFSGSMTDLHGLRLFILSACQTGMLDLHGARDEVRSLATGLLQAGAAAVIASQWSVDDKATYLLMVKFFQEWLTSHLEEPPAAALVRAQQWLRTVSWEQLRQWQSTKPLPRIITEMPDPDHDRQAASHSLQIGRMRGGEEYLSDRAGIEEAEYEALRYPRYGANQAQDIIQAHAERQINSSERPYRDPFYWAGFSLHGW